VSLSGASAFVTGGSGGLGAAIGNALAGQGVDVAIGYRRGEARAEAVCEQVGARGRRAITVPIDQSCPESIDAAIARVTGELGGLDILVNNAGIALGGHTVAPGDLAALTPEIWDQLMAVNLRGPYLVTRAAAPHLRTSAWGRVVNIGSTLGHGTWYADRAFMPSKAAVVPLTRFLAASLAPDVTVNCVAPGLMVETGLGGGGPEELYGRWRDCALLGATTAIGDIADQVVCLCRSATTTGQTVVVDGGIHFS